MEQEREEGSGRRRGKVERRNERGGGGEGERTKREGNVEERGMNQEDVLNRKESEEGVGGKWEGRGKRWGRGRKGLERRKRERGWRKKRTILGEGRKVVREGDGREERVQRGRRIGEEGEGGREREHILFIYKFGICPVHPCLTIFRPNCNFLFFTKFVIFPLPLPPPPTQWGVFNPNSNFSF